MGEKILTIPSVTQASRGRELLLRRGINAEIRRLSGNLNYEGCMQGIVVNANYASTVVEILRKNGIKVTHIKNI
ncbi:MAG: DUF3343 domain-containing protein [Oscillospiraceae bacterium]|jgi:pantoate kinase|nr:DUF3343 domain-containing protein [Oscillospiraceae bacterium]